MIILMQAAGGWRLGMERCVCLLQLAGLLLNSRLGFKSFYALLVHSSLQDTLCHYTPFDVLQTVMQRG
jgi:hypothetical protein